MAVASGVCGSLLLMWGHFAVGSGFLVLSVAALHWPHSIWTATGSPELTTRQRRLGLLAICTVAVFFRTYKLEPPGIWGDDAINGLLAFDVLDGKITSPFQLVTHAKSAFHALTNYAIAGAFWLFGPGPVSLRLPGIAAGILAVPVFSGIVSPLFGARVALVAALFFASSALQVSHAKVLIQIVFGEFFLLLGLCALVQGLVRRRRWLVVSAGVPLALCIYTYHSAKLAPLVPLIFLAALWRRAPTHRRRSLRRDGAALAGVFLFCIVPAVVSYIQDPSALTQRASGVALWPAVRDSGSLQPLWNALWRTLLIFHYQQGPAYNWFGIGSDPALNPVVAFLLLHGMTQSLRRWREPRHLLLLGWVAIGLLPGLLSTEAPRVYRVFLASPPLYVWAALPVVQLLGWAPRAARRRALGVAIALLVLVVPMIDFNYYFYRVYTNRAFRSFQAARMVEMARALKARGPGWTGYVLSTEFSANYETLAFLSRAWRLTMRDVTSLADVLPVRRAPAGGVLFMLDRDNIAARSIMHAWYPRIALDIRTDPPIRSWWFDRWVPLTAAGLPAPPTVAFFPVSHRAAAAAHGLTATFLAADGRPMISRTESELGLRQGQALPSGATQVEWAGAVYAPTDGAYGFVQESSCQATVWIDARPLVSDREPHVIRALAQGLHQLTAEATLSGSPTLRLRWKPPGETLQSMPPALLFHRSEIHGLLAEYQVEGQTLRRIEPYPYYAFFPGTFAHPFGVHWRGRLHVPAPGGYRLTLFTNGRKTVALNGRPWQAAEALPAGVYDLDMRIADIRGAARVLLYWQTGTGPRQLIPPEAFTPPAQADR